MFCFFHLIQNTAIDICLSEEGQGRAKANLLSRTIQAENSVRVVL